MRHTIGFKTVDGTHQHSSSIMVIPGFSNSPHGSKIELSKTSTAAFPFAPNSKVQLASLITSAPNPDDYFDNQTIEIEKFDR